MHLFTQVFAKIVPQPVL